MQRVALALAVTSMALTSACAGRRQVAAPAPAARDADAASAATVYAARDVDVRPALIACPGYAPPLDVTQARTRMDVAFVVDSTGAVVPSSVRQWIRSQRPGSETVSASELALRQIMSCRYEPGQVAGRLVAVAMRERLYFP